MTIYAFTGHRPQDLPAGFDIYEFDRRLTKFLADGPIDDPFSFRTGGALGIDTMAADYACSLGRDIPFDLVLPFEIDVMSRFWPEASRALLAWHSQKAAEVEIIHPGGYDVSAYQTRNVAMIDGADTVLAFWSGKQFGGTFNAVRYAQRAGKPIWNLLPKQPVQL